MKAEKFLSVLKEASDFVLANRVGDSFQFRMSKDGQVTLYSSVFAVMTLHYTGALSQFTEREKREWAAYINSFQDPDTGIYRAPEIFEGGIEGGGHNEEHLALHLVAHILPALDLLDSSPKYKLDFARKFLNIETLRSWLSGRDWSKAWLEGNNLLFVGQLLVHMRETGIEAADEALEVFMQWLDDEVDRQTGLWGTNGFCDRYTAIYGGYHQLLLYYYLRRPLVSPEKLIDTTLSIQHIDGGYSQWNGGGTCQDVDAVDILVNLYKLTSYRRRDIRRSLRRSYASVMRRQTIEGGFCDRIGHDFNHMGMEMTRTPPDRANMFSTWFGVHTMALIAEIFKHEWPDCETFDDFIAFNRRCSMGWHRKTPCGEFRSSGWQEHLTDKARVSVQEAVVRLYRIKQRL
ncbi:hypothetical protein [Marinobacter sp. bablab_jr008]|uniref:prenyltransferase/squalene oxidase repeat-containing protein n=1 Tax=Marinobacter sp. bablab_jr008 TaxID=2755064 RepID=UPI0018F25D43|nr:hypothetical protein [Marinobacter sp. bablab_jr008]